LGLSSGCRDLSKFQLEEDQAYCGALVGAPVFHEGFIREGAPPVLRLRLSLDLAAIDTLPGTLTSDDQNRGLCRDEGGRLFDNAKLRAIAEVQHDVLSSLEFGEGRDHNFFSFVDSSCLGTLLAVVSLMQGGDIEIRMFKPAAEPASDAGQRERPGYGLFHLKAQNATNCDF
jgi:hypothetical protein